MAELIADGRAVTMDVAPLDIGRFARGEAARRAAHLRLILAAMNDTARDG